MKQKLIEIKNLLNAIAVKGDDVLYMAEAQVRVNKLLQECENTSVEPKESEVDG